jgi:hypothetical protein
LKRHAAAVLSAALLSGAAGACKLPLQRGWQQASQGPVRLAWRAPGIVSGEMFAMQVAVCPAQARLVNVEATMPEHGHGMNYAVRLQAQGRGRWRAEGLLWHMRGRWELRFDVEVDGRLHSPRHSVQLE